ncbi:MAG: ATP-binding protein, partial [Lachnospiraceae bacterium]|nr:ATP-binding protein [Lachnospiraceae bacterium]
DIDFDDHITLIVGKNGAGKTAILDAVAVSISTFLLGIDGGVSRSILKEDARYEFYDLNGTVDPQHQFPVTIESKGDCCGKRDIKWLRALNSANSKTTIKDAGELTEIAIYVQNQIMTGDKTLVLPLLSYYGTGRLYAQKKESVICSH